MGKKITKQVKQAMREARVQAKTDEAEIKAKEAEKQAKAKKKKPKSLAAIASHWLIHEHGFWKMLYRVIWFFADSVTLVSLMMYFFVEQLPQIGNTIGHAAGLPSDASQIDFWFQANMPLFFVGLTLFVVMWLIVGLVNYLCKRLYQHWFFN